MGEGSSGAAGVGASQGEGKGREKVCCPVNEAEGLRGSGGWCGEAQGALRVPLTRGEGPGGLTQHTPTKQGSKVAKRGWSSICQFFRPVMSPGEQRTPPTPPHPYPGLTSSKAGGRGMQELTAVGQAPK